MTGISFKPPQKITIVQSIIDQILGQIREQALKPGDKLPSERELISALGVSRSSVREALQGLVAMNVLDIRPGQGTFVKPKTLSFSWPLADEDLTGALWRKMRLDLVQARSVIDEAVAQASIEHADTDDLAIIGHHLSAYTAAMQFPERERLLRAHNAFHMAIAESTGNYFLVHMTALLLEDALPESLRYPEYRFEGDDIDLAMRMLAQEARDHEALYAALCERDSDKARLAVRKNMQLARDIIEQESVAMERRQTLPT